MPVTEEVRAEFEGSLKEYESQYTKALDAWFAQYEGEEGKKRFLDLFKEKP